MLTWLKSAFWGTQRREREIPLGFYRGLRMELDMTAQIQLYLGLTELETHSWIRRCSGIVASAIDVGAGDGELSLHLLGQHGIKRIFAFEPWEDARARLLRNLERNGYAPDQRLRVSGSFVGNTDDEGTCTLDSLLTDLELPCLVKVDVEGGELNVLSSSAGLLSTGKVFWLIETHSADLEARCGEILRRNGYETRIVPNGWYRKLLPERRPRVHNRWLVAEPKLPSEPMPLGGPK
jgi:hypothetical protein